MVDVNRVFDKMFDYNSLERDPNAPPLQEFMRVVLEAGAYGWMSLVCMSIMFHVLDPRSITIWMVIGVVTVCTLILGFLWWVHIMLYPYKSDDTKSEN